MVGELVATALVDDFVVLAEGRPKVQERSDTRFIEPLP